MLDLVLYWLPARVVDHRDTDGSARDHVPLVHRPKALNVVEGYVLD